jgi:hypothetical protein
MISMVRMTVCPVVLLDFLAPWSAPGPGFARFKARMRPILANIVGPPLSAARISTSIAASGVATTSQFLPRSIAGGGGLIALLLCRWAHRRELPILGETPSLAGWAPVATNEKPAAVS